MDENRQTATGIEKFVYTNDKISISYGEYGMFPNHAYLLTVASAFNNAARYCGVLYLGDTGSKQDLLYTIEKLNITIDINQGNSISFTYDFGSQQMIRVSILPV